MYLKLLGIFKNLCLHKNLKLIRSLLKYFTKSKNLKDHKIVFKIFKSHKIVFVLNLILKFLKYMFLYYIKTIKNFFISQIFY